MSPGLDIVHLFGSLRNFSVGLQYCIKIFFINNAVNISQDYPSVSENFVSSMYFEVIIILIQMHAFSFS